MKINVILLMSLLFIFSCNKDDDANPGNSSNIPVGTFSAEIDGELFDSPSTAAAVLSVLDTTILNTTFFQLNGADVFTSGLFKNMMIIFSAVDLNLTETTYMLDGECNSTILCPILLYSQNGSSENDPNFFISSTNASGGEFTITFSELDLQVGGNAIGTFSGTVYDETNEVFREVTKGKFNLQIQ